MQVPLYQPWNQATIVPFTIVPQLYQPSYQMTIVHKSNYPGARIFCHYCTYPIISAQFPYGESSRQTNLLVARCGPGGARWEGNLTIWVGTNTTTTTITTASTTIATATASATATATKI